jgi:hypothetical protein
MKVRCVRLLDPLGKPQVKSSWLTIGETYHVLEIVQDQGRWLFRLMGDEPNGVALFAREQFEITTSKIPESWVPGWGKDGFFELAPQAWGQIGFWEKYYDKNPEAVRIFEEERRKIISAET